MYTGYNQNKYNTADNYYIKILKLRVEHCTVK